MSRQVEQALLSLMPTYGSDLPPQLVELAGSLLAQSRHCASTLKAEEEIARLYACANIACDRLKITLDLPPIQPRPPIPPRIYKRLYTHLDNILPKSGPGGRSSERVRTPSSKLRGLNGSPASGSRPTPSRGTPAKEQSLGQFRTPTKADAATPTKSTGKRAAPASGDGLHPWIQPCIRFMCQETNHKKLAPTILAGMESIVTPEGRRTDDEWVLHNTTALFGALFFFVMMRVKALESGEANIDREGYVPQRNELLALLGRARKEANVRVLDEADTWQGWNTIKPKELDSAVAQVTERGWLTGDWYQGIADVVKLTQRNHLDDAEMPDDDEATPKMQVKRADSMFQDKYDYLSEAKRTDYSIWKRGMATKIHHLMAESMEVDT